MNNVEQDGVRGFPYALTIRFFFFLIVVIPIIRDVCLDEVPRVRRNVVAGLQTIQSQDCERAGENEKRSNCLIQIPMQGVHPKDSRYFPNWWWAWRRLWGRRETQMIVAGKMNGISNVDRTSTDRTIVSWFFVECVWTAGESGRLAVLITIRSFFSTTNKTAAMNPRNKEIIEAFNNFPFATDQEYQVGPGLCSSRSLCAVPLGGELLTVLALCPNTGGPAGHPLE